MHAMKNIFWELYQVCHFRNGCDNATMAWYTLKARALQNELIAKNFIDHKIVVQVMHQHLKNNVVPKSIYKNDKKEWKEAIKRLTKELALAPLARSGAESAPRPSWPRTSWT